MGMPERTTSLMRETPAVSRTVSISFDGTGKVVRFAAEAGLSRRPVASMSRAGSRVRVTRE
jgi:hypothetical protein